jgi:hypothetical protein
LAEAAMLFETAHLLKSFAARAVVLLLAQLQIIELFITR